MSVVLTELHDRLEVGGAAVVLVQERGSAVVDSQARVAERPIVRRRHRHDHQRESVVLERLGVLGRDEPVEARGQSEHLCRSLTP